MKQRVKSAPKELVRRGLDDGTERLRSQLRDTAQRGQADDYGGDRIEDAAVGGVRRTERGMESLLKQRKRGNGRERDGELLCPADPPTPQDSPAEPSPQGPPRIKTREAVTGQESGVVSADGGRTDPTPTAGSERQRIKIRDRDTPTDTPLTPRDRAQTPRIKVDELDRCLPDYAIKTLERLHHLFSGLKNTVLVMALDKTQLGHTIKKIFGENTDCDAYLQKFIDFELKIDTGIVNESFLDKYSDYITLFDESILEPWTGIHDYIAALFSEMEIRRQEHLIKKVHIIHKLLFGSQNKKDFSFLCFELLMAVLSEKSIAKENAPFYYRETKSRTNDFTGYVLQVDNSLPHLLVDYIRKNWTYQIGIQQGFGEHGPYYGDTLDIPLLLIGYSELVYYGKGILSHRPEYSRFTEYIDNFNALKRMLEIIE